MSVISENVINIRKLASWMDDCRIPGSGVGQPHVLGGGTQNILLCFTRGDREYVLRRPPLNSRPQTHEAMRREAKILAALAATDVPHARLIAACADEAVIGVPFYLMEKIDGFNAVLGLPAPHVNSAEMRRRMGFALVEGAAAISRVDYRALGLADLQRKGHFLDRQCGRWCAQLEGYRSHRNWPGADSLPELQPIIEFLDQCKPRQWRPGLMHGDYAIGNVMYRSDSAELAAVVDWELATIGDPLLDLAWIVATWQGAGELDLPVLKLEPFDGFPTADELVQRYAEKTGYDSSDFDWYVVLACFKLAIILEGTFARACAGIAPMATGLVLHETAIKLLRRARARIENATS